ncbi:hypothetical protein GOODEAATRI_032759 [Goodea atripinnis]|uniref:Uncharacterized protein n=1 Tax=Goodea atripinnis TaxID=208336 RepID=A0ABV0NI08_9TELE
MPKGVGMSPHEHKASAGRMSCRRNTNLTIMSVAIKVTIMLFSLQVLNLVQSFVTLRVPLHVSYVFHSPVGAGGWQHFDLQSELRLTFVYDTAILWRDGVGSPPEAELQGKCVTTLACTQ